MLSDIKSSALWALSGAAIAVIAFMMCYVVLHDTFPGYKILVYPGIIATRFFSEELNFWPKFGVLVVGQYLTFFFAIFVGKKISRYMHKK